MIRKSIFSSLCITAFVIFFIVSLVSADTETFDETYEVSSGTLFEIRNRNGSVNIQGWDRSQIKVHAAKKTHWGGKLENVEIQVSEGPDFKIETIHLVKNPRVSVSYDLRVPLSVIVKFVRTSNGKIELEATHGDTEVEASNGKIEVKDAVGDINAHTSNGAIEIKDVKGFISAHTSNGAIELNLASDLNVDLEAKTSNGKIKLDDLEVVVKEISKNTLRGKIGKGGKKISCRTSNGRIVLKKLK